MLFNVPEPCPDPIGIPTRYANSVSAPNARCGRCPRVPGAWLVDAPDPKPFTLETAKVFAGKHLLRRGRHRDSIDPGDTHQVPAADACHWRSRLYLFEQPDPILNAGPSEETLGEYGIQADPVWTLAFARLPGFYGWLLIAGGGGFAPFGLFDRAFWGCGLESASVIVPPETGTDRYDVRALTFPFRCDRENTFSIIGGDVGHPYFDTDTIKVRPWRR